METKPKNEYLLSSVKNALRILRSFSMDEPEKKNSDLALSLGLSKSAVSRLMSTLASEDFVVKDPETKRYRLGLSVLALSGVVTNHLEIYREAQPILNKLVEDTEETAQIAVLEGIETVYLHKVECKHPVRILSYAGKRNPSYATSSGKVLLAYQDNDVVEQVINNGLQAYTKNTITDPEELRTSLKTIKEQGFAVSKEELLEGVITISAPIRDYTGKVIAAVTIAGPVQRIPHYKIGPYTKKVMSACMEISDRLGFWR